MAGGRTKELTVLPCGPSMAETDNDHRCLVITYNYSSRTGVVGELQTTAAEFTFGVVLPEAQQTVTRKVRCISMHQNEATLNGLTTPQKGLWWVHVSLDSLTVNFDESLQEKIDVNGARNTLAEWRG